MKALALIATLAFSASAFAAIPKAVTKAADDLKAQDVRTIIVKTAGDNPCDGGYVIKIQVKQAFRTDDGTGVGHKWETVKVIGADKDGGKMEICME